MTSTNPSVRALMLALSQYQGEWMDTPRGRRRRRGDEYRAPYPEGELVARMHPAVWNEVLRDPGMDWQRGRGFGVSPLRSAEVARGLRTVLFGVDVYDGPELPHSEWRLLVRQTGECIASGEILDERIEQGQPVTQWDPVGLSVSTRILTDEARRILVEPEIPPDPPPMSQCARHEWDCRMDSVCPIYEQCVALDRQDVDA